MPNQKNKLKYGLNIIISNNTASHNAKIPKGICPLVVCTTQLLVRAVKIVVCTDLKVSSLKF